MPGEVYVEGLFGPQKSIRALTVWQKVGIDEINVKHQPKKHQLELYT